MKMFFDDSKTLYDAGVQIRQKKHYIELEYPVEQGTSAYLYLFPDEDEGTCTITTCWNKSFDFLLSDLSDEAKTVIVEYFPTSLKLLQNKMKNKSHKPQLLRAEDPKDGQIKWVICKEVENLPLEDYEDIREVPGLEDEVKKVIEKSIAVKDELLRLHADVQDSQPQAAGNQQAFRRGVAEGAGRGLGGLLFGIAASVFLGVDVGGDF